MHLFFSFSLLILKGLGDLASFSFNFLGLL
jgi:hypothetical protein